MTVGAQYEALKLALEPVYGPGEATAMATMLIEHFTRIDQNSLPLRKHEELKEPVVDSLENALHALLLHEPLQYVLKQAWFYGRPFYVNKHVLIPRPETEELVQETIQWLRKKLYRQATMQVLDIGTGSGCIPITIKKECPACQVYSVDISQEALEVARKNAELLQADMKFIEGNFLDENTWHQFQQYDVIISNPPYIPQSEKQKMDKHVADWEPAMALFVPDDDALLFYRKIGDFAKNHLAPNGKIFLECHYEYAKATAALMVEMGFEAALKKDMHGNDRMIIAQKPNKMGISSR